MPGAADRRQLWRWSEAAIGIVEEGFHGFELTKHAGSESALGGRLGYVLDDRERIVGPASPGRAAGISPSIGFGCVVIGLRSGFGRLSRVIQHWDPPSLGSGPDRSFALRPAMKTPPAMVLARLESRNSPIHDWRNRKRSPSLGTSELHPPATPLLVFWLVTGRTVPPSAPVHGPSTTGSDL